MIDSVQQTLTQERALQTQAQAGIPSLGEIEPEERLKVIPQYDRYAQQVARIVHDRVLRGGELARSLADFVHGVWLGHPLHAVLTDFTIGAWSLGALMDLVSLTGSRRARRTADQLTTIGVVAALPTAVAGLADYSTLSMGAMRTGATHGLLNAIALGLYTLSVISRKVGNRLAAIIFSGLAFSVVMASAWLGGEMVYRYRVSVNKAERPRRPRVWQPVLDQLAVREGQPVRIEVEGQPVLLYRRQGEIYAIGAACAHEGGPLEQGKFHGTCVECPWHQSVYDMRTGRVVHGPATYPVPAYDTRVRNGKVELRLKSA